MEYHDYYDGFDWKGVTYYNDLWLIVIIEAAYYCESRGEDYIRYSHLKALSDQALRRETKGEKSLGSESFRYVIYDNRHCKKFLSVEKVNSKLTKIYPNIPKIQKEVKARQIRNLSFGDKSLLRKVNRKDTTLNHHKRIDEPPIKVSDSITRTKGVARTLPTESVSISDKVSIVVTHAKKN